MGIELKHINTGTLSQTQQEALSPGDTVIDINILSGSKNIPEFDGTLTVSLPYAGPLPVAAWYLSDAGELEKLACSYDQATKSVTFALSHLSLYVVGQDKSAGRPD